MSGFPITTRQASISLLLTGMLCLSGLSCWRIPQAHAQLFEEDPALKPQSPTEVPAATPSKQMPTGRASTTEQAKPKIILKGSITSLETALVEEQNQVDWYGWYMACRQYLILTGGIACPVGTKIKFSRAGLMTPYSTDANCVQSVLSKRFPLPTNTKVQGIILPVRSSQVPPASPQELYWHLKGSRP